MTSTYGGQLASYYYGLLLSYDKDRWFREVKELIENGKKEYLDYSRTLKTNSAISFSIRSGKYQDIQSLYQFNNDEYAQYQQILQRVKEK